MIMGPSSFCLCTIVFNSNFQNDVIYQLIDLMLMIYLTLSSKDSRFSSLPLILLNTISQYSTT